MYINWKIKLRLNRYDLLCDISLSHDICINTVTSDGGYYNNISNDKMG